MSEELKQQHNFGAPAHNQEALGSQNPEALGHNQETHGGHDAEEYVTVATFPEPMEASMARMALESAGISVFLRGETANSLLPVAFISQLQVRPEDEAAARRVLDAFTDSPASMESVTAAELEDEEPKF
jgi:hypothetical protein